VLQGFSPNLGRIRIPDMPIIPEPAALLSLRKMGLEFPTGRGLYHLVHLPALARGDGLVNFDHPHLKLPDHPRARTGAASAGGVNWRGRPRKAHTTQRVLFNTGVNGNAYIVNESGGALFGPSRAGMGRVRPLNARNPAGVDGVRERVGHGVPTWIQYRPSRPPCHGWNSTGPDIPGRSTGHSRTFAKSNVRLGSRAIRGRRTFRTFRTFVSFFL